MQLRKPYGELTLTSVIGGVLVGLVLNMGICYAGLQIGFTIVGSSVAAVLGFGLLRGLLRRGSILEVNVLQTVASAVNTVNAGIIFTVPVLFLMGRGEEIDYPVLILAAVSGALLGVVIIIPLRKQMVDLERLRFPEAVAVAAILKSPGAGVRKALLLVVGAIVAATLTALSLVKVGVSAEPIIPSFVNLGRLLHIPAGLHLVFAVSFLSLGAGFLTGRPGLAMLYGSILNLWILVPVCLALNWLPPSHSSATFWSLDHGNAAVFLDAFTRFTSRHVGIGMILGGALAGILVALPAMKSAFKSLAGAPVAGHREELSVKVLGGGGALGMLLLFLAAKLSGGAAVSWPVAGAVAVVGGIWLWISGLVVAQCMGRTNWSPLSGLALIAITIMLGIMGTGDAYVIPAVTVGAAICVATSMCADMMADLKAGYLVGSRPIKQQVAQMATCWIGPTVTVLTVLILWRAYAFGPDQAEILHRRGLEGAEVVAAVQTEAEVFYELPGHIPELGAPQASALQAAIRIVQSGDAPLGKYLTGAAIGALISLLISPGLGVMVGLSLYLPFEYMIVFGVGCLIHMLVTRIKGPRFAEDYGVPLAAGLIVGDAVLRVGFAVCKVISDSLGGGA